MVAASSIDTNTTDTNTTDTNTTNTTTNTTTNSTDNSTTNSTTADEITYVPGVGSIGENNIVKIFNTHFSFYI